MLDVDGRVDADAVAEQFFHVEIAFRMSTLRGVRMRQLVDEYDLWMPSNDGIEVHFLEPLTFVLDLPVRYDLEALQKRFCFLASVGLDNTNNDIVAIALARSRLLQHLVGLADARRGSDKDL